MGNYRLGYGTRLHMRYSFLKGSGVLLAFFCIVFSIAFAFNTHFPQLVVAGESSVGTWMSGALLVISATLCLILGMRHRAFTWFFITGFFFLLASDERFMFHEHLKEKIMFTFYPAKSFRWIRELPVIAGAALGAFVAYILWNHVKGSGKILLLLAVFFGTVSVVMDIFSAGVIPEDCCKLIAELLITLSLLKTIEV